VEAESGPSKPLKVFISSGEPSSDLHAAAYLKALEKLVPTIQAIGVGGPSLQANKKFRCLLSQEKLTAMGFVEVLGKIPSLLRSLSDLEATAAAERPDFAVLFDYPDFHFKLAARLKALGIPVICFIPPKIWAWRTGRIQKIKELYRHVFTILPFETDLYRLNQVPMDYVGNPLMDELPFNETLESARSHFNLSPEDQIFLLMPGSRKAELKYLLKPFLRTAEILLAEKKAESPGFLNGECWKILLPLPNAQRAAEVREKIDAFGFGHLPIQMTIGDSGLAMKVARAGLIKSGTSSLEAALLNCPHVVTYQGHFLSKVVFKAVVRYFKAISLVNLVDDFQGRKEKFIVPELILKDFGVDRFVEALRPLLQLKSEERERMLEGFARVRKKLEPLDGVSPMAFAASRSLALLEEWRKQV
jgi:lipid-A-disaccharide synthase